MARTQSQWSAVLRNNTDYPNGIEFTDIPDIREFIAQYYRGEVGDLYSETWRVYGDYPDDLFDVLEPDAYEDNSWYPL